MKLVMKCTSKLYIIDAFK